LVADLKRHGLQVIDVSVPPRRPIGGGVQLPDARWRALARRAIETSDVIVLVADGRQPPDLDGARRFGKPVVVLGADSRACRPSPALPGVVDARRSDLVSRAIRAAGRPSNGSATPARRDAVPIADALRVLGDRIEQQVAAETTAAETLQAQRQRWWQFGRGAAAAGR
jgi:hypothetical protein